MEILAIIVDVYGCDIHTSRSHHHQSFAVLETHQSEPHAAYRQIATFVIERVPNLFPRTRHSTNQLACHLLPPTRSIDQFLTA